jgi:hypothetical protein
LPKNQAIHILFYSSWNVLKIDHILGHKASLKKFKKIKINPCIISDHNRIKLDHNKRNHRKHSNTGRMKNTLLKDQCVTEEIKNFLESNENENTIFQSLWDTAKAMLMGSSYHKCLH